MHSKNSKDLNILNSDYITEKSRKEEAETSNKLLENNILETEEILKKEKEEEFIPLEEDKINLLFEILNSKFLFICLLII